MRFQVYKDDKVRKTIIKTSETINLHEVFGYNCTIHDDLHPTKDPRHLL